MVVAAHAHYPRYEKDLSAAPRHLDDREVAALVGAVPLNSTTNAALEEYIASATRCLPTPLPVEETALARRIRAAGYR